MSKRDHPDSETLTVVKKVGPSTYLLSDGWKWNASKLAHFRKEVLTCISKDSEIVLDGLIMPENESHNAPETGPRRGLRDRNPPRWLTGFVK